MTREEAINKLRDMITEIRAICDESKHMSEDDRQDMETFDMAIKALEQEPRKDEIILTKEEYGELVSSEFDNGYTKGYTEALEQNDVLLDKIRAEIEQTVSRYSISRERGGMGQIEWSDRLIKESEVLQIIDKYRESEE